MPGGNGKLYDTPARPPCSAVFLGTVHSVGLDLPMEDRLGMTSVKGEWGGCGSVVFQS